MPTVRESPLHFSAPMRAIHWTTVGLIAAVLILAWTWPNGKARGDSLWLLLHESAGLVILALTVVRIAIRSSQDVPPESHMLTRFEAVTSRLTHVLLYVLMIGMPATGFLWATSTGKPVDVFGMFEIPPLLPPIDTLHAIARALHKFGQYAVYALVGLHAAGGLFHFIVRRDDVMGRMLPWAERFIRPRVSAEVRPAVR
jgi:cytochrome b561